MTRPNAVSRKKAEASTEQLAAVELVWMAKELGLSLTSPNELLQQFTKTVLETALNEEMIEHLVMNPVGPRPTAKAQTCATDHGRRRC